MLKSSQHNIHFAQADVQCLYEGGICEYTQLTLL